MPERPDPGTPVDLDRLAAVEAAADAALLAPSVHNTQPWLLVLHPDRIDVRLDDSRRLAVADPAGRELVISVGSALFNARVALAGAGLATAVHRWPSTPDRDLAAVVGVVDGAPDHELAALAPAVSRRRTNRRGFTDEPVPDEVLRRVHSACLAEDTTSVEVLDEDQHRLVARLSQIADAEQNADAAYRHEVRVWTNRQPGQGDGVPAEVVPRVDGTAQDDVPIRDFDTRGDGGLPGTTASGRTGSLVVLATHGDDRESWLRAGEALQRVLLELTVLGWAASPLTQVVEVAHTRAALRRELCWDVHPQLLLRIGRAVPTAASPRRARDDVVRGSSRPARHFPPRPGPTGWPARGVYGPDGPWPVPDGRGGTTWR